MNNVVLSGRLTKAPEVNVLQKGTSVARFTLAVNRNYKDKDGNTPVDFIPIEAMGKLAETCGNYLDKGKEISVIGSIRIDKYETKEGEKRTFTKVFMSSLHFHGSKKDSQGGGSPQVAPNEYTAIEDEELPF